MNLILFPPDEVAPDGRVVIRGVQAEHIRTVLKVVPGHHIRVGLLDGPKGVGTIESMSGSDVIVSVEWEDEIPAPPPVDLLLALPRPKVMKRLWA